MRANRFLAVAMVAFVAIAALLTSCESDPTTEGVNSNITLYNKVLEALPEGGVSRFNYDIKDRDDAVNLVVECDDEWVTKIEVRYTFVDVTVARNSTGSERTTTLKLSYGKDTTSLKLVQQPWDEPLVLTVDKIEATSVTISVVALDEQTTWIGQIVGKEWFDSFTEEEIFAEDLGYYYSMASEAEVSIEEYLRSILSRGSHSGIRMRGLDVDSEYVVYVYGLSEIGEKTTELYYEEFRTTPPYEGNDVTFTFDIRCERSMAVISIEPSHEGVAYYHNITTRQHLDECGGDINALVSDVVGTALDNYLYWDYTEEEFFKYNTEYLETSYDLETTANTEYVVFAFKWDESLKPLSEVSYTLFTSADIPPSENKLSMTISDVTQTTFYVETTTTNNDPYTIFAVPAREIDKYITDKAVFEYLIMEYGAPSLAYNQCTGDVKGTFSGLESDTEYVVLLFGYEAGVRTTAMVRKNIKTAKAGDVDACVYNVSISGVTDRTAYVEITPSDYSVWYYWNVFEKSATEEQIKEYIYDTYNSYYYADYWEFSCYEVTQGEVSSNLSQLRPNTDYKVVIVPMNPNRFEYTGTVRAVGEFRTGEAVIADITITAGFDAYYDGDEVYALEPDFLSSFQGYAIIPMSVNIEGQYSGFLYTIFDYVEGLEDPEQYGDDILLDTLYEVGAYWTPAYFRGEWDKPMLIAAVAFDLAGNPSRVYREKFTCTRDGAGDAQEFVDYFMGSRAVASESMSKLEGCDVAKMPLYRPIVEKKGRGAELCLKKE